MCGRFTQMYTWKELVELYRLTMNVPPTNLRPRYNVCPTTKIDTVRIVDGGRVFEPMRRGHGSDVVEEAHQGIEARHVQRAG